jgi:hypothetical protein
LITISSIIVGIGCVIVSLTATGGVMNNVLAPTAKDFPMKYRLRFFLFNDKPMCEQYCFASADSNHVPGPKSLVYLGDETIDDKHQQGIEKGVIYQVVERVFCYNNYKDGSDDLTSVEISVQRTNK